MRSALSRFAATRLRAMETEAPCRWARGAAAAAAAATSSIPSSSSSFTSIERRALSTSTSPSSSSSPSSSRPVPPSKFMADVFARASANPQRILMNEPGDPRVLAAAATLAERGLCLPVLLGSRSAIHSFSQELARKLLQREKEEEENGSNGRKRKGNGNGTRSSKSSCSEGEELEAEALPADLRFLRGLSKCEILDPFSSEEVDELSRRYAHELAEARKHKGMTLEMAKELLKPEGENRGGGVPNASIHFATMMLRSGDAGGLLSGAAHTTLETVRPALQLLTRKQQQQQQEEEREGSEGTKIAPPGLVSSLFFMCLPRGVVAFADCALNVSPNPSELARIALDSAATARNFGLTPPRVALLSYSTRGSGRGAGPDAAAAAAEAARRAAPEGVFVDGPLQYDASVSPSVAALKLGTKVESNSSPPPHFDVAGRANVLVFPDLNAGNISYKAVQQSTGAAAVGPVLQGLVAPVNDLSRGASVDDIVCTAAVTAVQAIAAAEARGREARKGASVKA